MATLRASRRSRASLPIRCALGADGFMTERRTAAETNLHFRGSATAGQRRMILPRLKLVLNAIRISDRSLLSLPRLLGHSATLVRVTPRLETWPFPLNVRRCLRDAAFVFRNVTTKHVIHNNHNVANTG